MKRISILLLTVLFLAACGKDDDVAPAVTNNSNDNANAVLTEKLYTESTTTAATKSAACHALEIPRLVQSANDGFVVHTLPDGRVNYCMEFDLSLRACRWVAYKWYNGFSSNETPWNRNNWRNGSTFNGYGGDYDPFQPDPVLPENACIGVDEIGRSGGGQRGHQLGSADRLNSMEANGQTFYMSNMLPQRKGFNEQGIWFNLESFLRKNYDTSSFRDTLYVVKGGTVTNGDYRKLGQEGKLVSPNYFFMAILKYRASESSINGGYAAIGFYMKHEDNTDAVSAKYAVSIDRLEELTGIDFFCNLPDGIENAVESARATSYWKLK